LALIECFIYWTDGLNMGELLCAGGVDSCWLKTANLQNTHNLQAQSLTSEQRFDSERRHMLMNAPKLSLGHHLMRHICYDIDSRHWLCVS